MMNIEGVELNLYLSSDVIIKPPLSPQPSQLLLHLFVLMVSQFSVHLYIHLNTPLFLLLFKCLNHPSYLHCWYV